MKNNILIIFFFVLFILLIISISVFIFFTNIILWQKILISGLLFFIQLVFIIINKILLFDYIVPIKKLKNIIKKNNIQNYEISLNNEKLKAIYRFFEKYGIDSEEVKKNFEEKILLNTEKLKLEIENKTDLNNKITDEYLSLIHDIKNHLTVIGGYASALMKYKKRYDEDIKQKFLNRIINVTDRLSRVIKDFLHFVNEKDSLENLEFCELNIEFILEYFYNIYEIKAKERKINFVLNIKKPLPLILGNKEKLEFVISNILSNAFKYVLIEGIISINAFLNNNRLRVEISNSGYSVKDSEEEIIFEKFKKSVNHDNQMEGSGLGLYISKKIIEKHNGIIGVKKNNEGGGTTFYFDVPIIDNDNR